MLRAWAAVLPLASHTWAVKLYVPALLGTPEMLPFEPRFRPGGMFPVSVHEYGGTPPLAFSETLYEEPCVAGGREVVATISGELDPAVTNVAAAVLQLAAPLKVKLPEKDPMLDRTASSVAAREPLGFACCSSIAAPPPALTVTEVLDGKPRPANVSSLAACVWGVFPVVGEALLP